MRAIKYLLTFLLILSCLKTTARTYYISTGGSLKNKGTKTSPFSFDYLYQKINHAGDTFIVMCGVYKGHHITNVYGRPGKPVIVKSEEWLEAKLVGQREKVEGKRRILWIKGDYSHFSGFEIYDTETDRITSDGSAFYLSSGISLYGKYSKAHSNVIHDVSEGIESWSPAIGSELSWNYVYNVGWQASNGGHGHLAYIQNRKDINIRKTVAYNVGFSNAGEGMHIYTEKGNISNINVLYNFIFRTGTLSKVGRGNRTYIMGGKQEMLNLTCIGNHSYGSMVQIGYDKWWFTKNLIFDDNYITGSIQFKGVEEVKSFKNNTVITNNDFIRIQYKYDRAKQSQDIPIENNTIYKFKGTSQPKVGLQQADKEGRGKGTVRIDLNKTKWGDKNTALVQSPPQRYFLYINQYNPSIANVYVYNPDSLDRYPIKLDGFAKPGDNILIRDVEKIHNVYAQTYQHELSLPMDLTEVALPIGDLPKKNIQHTDKSIGVFVLENLGRAVE
ncbi:hypothetical protein QQ008_29425 [Fulvivirgaceae bacterium BMA10]|uniref:Right-handed parallel beta-helix repeat-containing protein n=1 Tax=Splendidivirga corallicola TaxID=3051826 RepID=A0ABT8KXU1_9BACT|nr:hypothetical protein [Fulvivirgaceae bacterium BMA10]